MKRTIKKSNIQEVFWDKLVENLIYKAESAGIKVILVNPENTSKRYSNCSNFAVDRDINAAKNIKSSVRALRLLNRSFRSLVL